MKKKYKIFILASIAFIQLSLEASSMNSEEAISKNKRTLAQNKSDSRDSDEETSDRKAPITRKTINLGLPNPIIGSSLLDQQHAIPEEQPNNSVPSSPSYPGLILSPTSESSPPLIKPRSSQLYDISHLSHGESIPYSYLFPPESRT